MFRKVAVILLHLLFWVFGIYIISKVFGVSSVEVFAESNSNEEQQVIITYDDNFVWATIVTVFLSAVVFYTNVFVLLRSYFKSRKLFNYLPKLIGILLLAIILVILFNRYVNYTHSMNDGLFMFPSLGLHIALFIFYTALSVAYAFTSEWFKNEKLRNEITQEKLSTELNFLKAQINPHFLFNTLNNLFSISQKHNIPELSTGISELSNLMRYMLYESNASFVSLKKEIDYIESFIEIQKLRYDEGDFIINFDKKGNPDQIKVAPMILLPFVENAFKHGFSVDENSIIKMFLDVTDGNIYFRVKNKIFEHQGLSESASGIGLENVKRRLELIYPNLHTLEISEKEHKFTVELNIKTND
tara:strand:- start:23377 stop:24450 length:1074 start_codon:yes stop_codon:yes gene_type:complete